jgi:hypothetical protein
MRKTEVLVKPQPWLFPRTRVGIVATLAAVGCVGYVLLGGTPAGWGFGGAVVGSMLLAWTALLRHNERCISLWVCTAVVTGWVVAASYRYLAGG